MTRAARFFMRLLALSALLLALALPAHAADKLRLERMDLKASPTFKLYLTYVDPDGRVIVGRNKEDFKLVLDSADQGAAKSLTTFGELLDSKDPKVTETLSVVVVVQVSGAMQEVIDELKKGVKQLTDAVGAKSKIALLAYSSETKRLAELNTPADYDSAVASLAIDTEGVEVHMLDAVRTAIDLLNAAPKGQRKMVVLFSDGLDVNLERKAFLGIGKKAQDAGIVINTIGYAPFEVAKLKNLQELSKQSNGSERICKSGAEISQQFSNIGDEMKKQYVVTFDTVLAGGDGKDRTFQVLMEAPGHSAYSNTIIDKIPKAVRPVVAGRAWLWWLLGLVLGLGVIVLLAWLIFFRAKPAPEPPPLAAPMPSESPKSRTMALDMSLGGKSVPIAWIVGLSGNHRFQTFKLKPARTSIGTGQECDIPVDDQFMSTMHCEIRFDGNCYKLIDAGSTNGIVVNDKRVREHDLVDNDQFRLGRSDFKFKSL